MARPADLDPGDPPEGLQVAAFRSPRRELWGIGEALRIALPAPWPDHVARVPEALASITSVDEVGAPGSGPVAFGALATPIVTLATVRMVLLMNAITRM